MSGKKKALLNGKPVKLSKLPSSLRKEEEGETDVLPMPNNEGTQKGLELSNQTNTRMVGVKLDSKKDK